MPCNLRRKRSHRTTLRCARAMVETQICFDDAFEFGSRTCSFRRLHEHFCTFFKGFVDTVGQQILLAFEMLVEAPMGQLKLLHEAGNRHVILTATSKPSRGCLENPITCFLLV